jgi:hypothetical protein
VNTKRNLLFTVAEEQASRHHAEHAAVFGQVPVRVSQLLKRVGIGIRIDPNLREDGVVERYHGPPTRFAIRIRGDLSPTRGRFVLAHELGHVLLLTQHEKLADRWDLRTREKFANVFARELLIPTSLRGELRQRFKQISSALELLRLTDQWGIHPVAGIRFAASHFDWTAGHPRIILKVAYTPNRFTGKEQRLRVVAAAFDRDRFYVATNQSFQRLSPDESWLALLPAGSESAQHNVTFRLATRTFTGAARYKTVEYACDVSALRLTSHRGTNTGSYLVVVEPVVSQ